MKRISVLCGSQNNQRLFSSAIRQVQVNQNGLKLNGAHQLLVYRDDVNVLGGSAHTIKENAVALTVVSKDEVEYNEGQNTIKYIS